MNYQRVSAGVNVVLLLGASLGACAQQALPCSQTLAAPFTAAAANPAARAERDVASVIDAFHAAAAASDEGAYFALFARQGVFLGTDASERWSVSAFREYAHPHFAAGRGWTYVPRDRHISFAAAGEVAWFDELLDHGKYGELRGSGVLVREARASGASDASGASAGSGASGAWKIAQYNLTFTVPNAAAAQVVPLLRIGAAPQPTP